jgi:hypothetical protein
MFALTSGESILASRPARAAFQRLPASTVISTSAGVRSPSERSRSKSWAESPPKLFTWIPVRLVNASIAGSWP